MQDNVVSIVLQSDIRNKEIVVDNEDLLSKISRVLKIDLVAIPDDITLIALGLDSLQAAEMQSIISYVSKDIVSVPELGKMTIGEIKEKFGKNYGMQPLSNETVSPVEHSDLSKDIVQIRDLIKQHGVDLIEAVDN